MMTINTDLGTINALKHLVDQLKDKEISRFDL